MDTRNKQHRWLLHLLGAAILLLGFTACSSSSDDDDIVIDADSGKFVEVPDPDTWVTDDDIKSEDLDLLVDLSVKVERIRQEFVLMLSNGGEGDKLFCGVGSKTDVGPTIRLFTDMMLKQDEYKTALEDLEGSSILKPTATRGKLKDIWDIITVGQTEAEAEKNKVQDILNQNKVFSNDNAQKQLYDFYCEQEPDYAKKIGAKDAKDFFNKLNNGDLNSYMLNISHIWRDKGILEADKTNSAVGDYAYTAFTGKAEYVNSAYRVSSKVAVAAGDLYLTAIDDLAGGYGSKIMDFGDAIKNKITKIKLMKKVLEGKPDWQGWNTYIVNNLKDDIKEAISEALGDDDSIGKDLVNMVTEEILDWVVEQCTVDEEGDDDSEEAKEKQEEWAQEDDIAILNIETDFSSQGKMILITDESTGKVNVATPTYDGHVSLATTPGTKIITVVKKNGERLTKRVTLVAGTNTVIIKSEQKPYIDLNPSSITLDDEAGSESAVILTNCKYIKLRQTKKEEWCDVQLEINGSAGRGFHVRVVAKANLDSQDRSGSFILEGYEEAKEDSKPVITRTFKYTQYAYSPELAPIDVSPTALTFDANGGEQVVTLNVKDYKYFGGFSDEDCSDWLSVVINDNTTLTVKAKANDTGAERYGTIYAFGTDDPDPKTLDQVAFKAIPVTQSAGGDVIPVGEFIYGNVNFSVKNGMEYGYNNKTKDTYSSESGCSYFGFGSYNPAVDSHTGNRNGFTLLYHNPYTSKDGNTLTFKMTQEYKYIQEYEAWMWATIHYEITVNMKASNPADLSTYRVTSISLYERLRESDDYYDPSNSDDYWDLVYMAEIEGEIPYEKTESSGYHIFKIKGESVYNAIKQNEYKTMDNHGNDLYGWKQVPTSPDKNDVITFRLYLKE